MQGEDREEDAGLALRRLAIAVRAAAIGVWDWDLDTGAFFYSARAREICGFSPDEPITYEKVVAVTHHDDLPRTTALARQMLDPAIRTEQVFRYRIRRADTGEIRWVQAHGEAVFQPAGGDERAVRFIGTLQDITEQKRAEDAVVESEARLRLAVEASRMAIWEVDFETGAVTHSPELNALFGFPPEAEPGVEEIRARYAPGEAERIQREGEEMLLRGETHMQTEFRQIRPDGTEGWLLMRAQVAPSAGGTGRRAVGVLLDITDRKQAEERFREMADNAPVMMWLTDTQDRLTFMSRSWYELTGQRPGQALGRGWLDALHPEDREAVDRQSLEVADRPVTFRAEYRVKAKDGSWRWVLDTAAPRFDREGVLVGHIGSVIDITERRQAEERRALLVNELNHRVKNTLATVQAIVGQTLRGTGVSGDVHRSLDARLAALARAHDVLTREHWEGAALADVVQQALLPFVEGAGSRIRVSGPAMRLASKAALAVAMALHELATNATKYGALSTEAGRIALRWEIDRDASEAAVLRLEWREEDGPPVAVPGRKGFGTRLLERSTATSLGGTVEIVFDETGVVCRIEAPLAGLAA